MLKVSGVFVQYRIRQGVGDVAGNVQQHAYQRRLEQVEVIPRKVDVKCLPQKMYALRRNIGSWDNGSGNGADQVADGHCLGKGSLLIPKFSASNTDPGQNKATSRIGQGNRPNLHKEAL